MLRIEHDIFRLRRKTIRAPRGIDYERNQTDMPASKNDLRELSIRFAVSVSLICDHIKGSAVYVNQLLRCSSSIGANIHEARYGQSTPDFISKLEISLKECSETDYWLELIYRTGKMTSEEYRSLANQCGTIRRILIASITTAKKHYEEGQEIPKEF